MPFIRVNDTSPALTTFMPDESNWFSMFSALRVITTQRLTPLILVFKVDPGTEPNRVPSSSTFSASRQKIVLD
jgi:hypothetical protein